MGTNDLSFLEKMGAEDWPATQKEMPSRPVILYCLISLLITENKRIDRSIDARLICSSDGRGLTTVQIKRSQIYTIQIRADADLMAYI